MEWHHALTRPVTVIKGIGDQQGKKLTAYMSRKTKREGSAEIRDLLFHLPYDYVDRRNIITLAEATVGIRTLKVRPVRHHPSPRHSSGKPVPYRIDCEDETDALTLVFFRGNATYLKKTLPVGTDLLVSGELQHYEGTWQMTHPDVAVPFEQLNNVCRLDAVYPATEGISARQMAKWVRLALGMMPHIPEWLLPSTKQHYADVSFTQALHTVHTPEEMLDIQPALERLCFDEALAHQLALGLLRKEHKRPNAPPITLLESDAVQRAISGLPFTLTDGQTEVLKDVSDDLKSGARMVRLLQGDVGAGKTVVAVLAMLGAYYSGAQAGIMAPTEILARQHLHSLEKLLGNTDIPVIFLAGSLTQKQRMEARERISTIPAALIVGTHALFQEGVEFANLALAVIDEQHRFGVQQRMALSDKGLHPHMLLMTATPIPRSLAMTQYGDLDVSVLKQKPANRLPIDTRVMSIEKLDALSAGIARALNQGEKIYWICPLVEESTTIMPEQSWQAAQTRYSYLEAMFPGKVGLVHGKMKMAEREPVMDAFSHGDIRILVATTVVEVGVDVPDATIMVIENAERFGLSTLHQLRGRVGRGDKASRCILLYGTTFSKTAQERLKTMRSTEDGFVISEADLKLRGSGELLGTRQTGLPEYCFLDVVRDGDILRAARKEAQHVLHEDPHMVSERGQALLCLMSLFNLDDAKRFLRSG